MANTHRDPVCNMQVDERMLLADQNIRDKPIVFAERTAKEDLIGIRSSM
jgi:hypothetical protein